MRLLCKYFSGTEVMTGFMDSSDLLHLNGLELVVANGNQYAVALWWLFKKALNVSLQYLDLIKFPLMLDIDDKNRILWMGL